MFNIESTANTVERHVVLHYFGLWHSSTVQRKRMAKEHGIDQQNEQLSGRVNIPWIFLPFAAVFHFARSVTLLLLTSGCLSDFLFILSYELPYCNRHCAELSSGGPSCFLQSRLAAQGNFFCRKNSLGMGINLCPQHQDPEVRGMDRSPF